MPMIKVYTTPNQLTSAEKAEFATVLTNRYAAIMPSFFVNVMFHELPEDSFFMGGEPTAGKFVRVTFEHIAVIWEDNEKDKKMAQQFLDWVGGLLKERFEERGWTWEYTVLQTEKELWRVQGFAPPEVGSEEMKIWEKAGKGVAWKS